MERTMKEAIRNTQFNAGFALIAILAFLFYANTFNHGYALDDGLMIRDNQLTRQGISAIPDILFSDQFVGIGASKESQLFQGSRYRPLSQIIFAIEFSLVGDSPAFMHVVNVLFYLLLLWVIYKTLHVLFPSNKKKSLLTLPFLATLVYALHPIHTEVVANIKSLDEILAMLLSMLSLLYSIFYIDKKKIIYLLYAFLALFGGLLAKENSITFLGIIPLGLFIFRNQGFKEQLKPFIPLMGAAILYFIFRYISLGFIMNGSESNQLFHNPFLFADTETKYGMILISWINYLKLLLVPYPLTHDYYPFMIPEQSIFSLIPMLSLLVHLGLAVLAIVLIQKRKISGFAIGFYFISFSIVSNLVFNLGILQNERLLFMSSLGFAVLVGLGFLYLQDKFATQNSLAKIPLSVGIIILMLYGAISINRNKAWKDDRTLFYTDVETSSESARCNVVAGTLMVIQAGELQAIREKEALYAKAEQHLEKGLKLYANNPNGWQALGDIALYRHQYVKAYTMYHTAYRFDTLGVMMRNNMLVTGTMALEQRDFAAAKSIADSLIQFDSHIPEYEIIKAEALQNGGQTNEAMNSLLQAESRFPEDALLLNKIAEYYARFTGNPSMSGVYLHKALKQNPNDSQTLENLGVFYGIQANYDSSLVYFKAALLQKPGNTSLIQNLVRTYRALGNETEAARYQAMLPR